MNVLTRIFCYKHSKVQSNYLFNVASNLFIEAVDLPLSLFAFAFFVCDSLSLPVSSIGLVTIVYFCVPLLSLCFTFCSILFSPLFFPSLLSSPLLSSPLLSSFLPLSLLISFLPSSIAFPSLLSSPRSFLCLSSLLIPFLLLSSLPLTLTCSLRSIWITLPRFFFPRL